MTPGRIVAKTVSGEIEGVFEQNQYIFKGIPYAAPPVDDLRWLPPQPPLPWKGIRPAFKYGTICPQSILPVGELIRYLQISEKQDEDCLFLNVHTPGLDDARRPVMVWIHGGAYIIGSGSQKMFQENTLASRCDIVLVTINYRLGALGFLNLNEITEGRIPATGCEGLLDQIAAIDWVRANIANFGGDPGNITIFGESAGGMSVGNLMGMPAAKGKFQKAILESGGAATVSPLAEGVNAAAQFLSILGLKGNDADKLRALATGQLIAAQTKLTVIMRRREGRITPFQPVVDGAALPEIPINAIKKGSAADVKTMGGTNLEEFKLFNVMDPVSGNVNEEGLISVLETLIPPASVPEAISVYRKSREDRGMDASASGLLMAIKTDLMFRIPVLRVVEAQSMNGQAAWNYLFCWKSPALGGALGACHALETGFIWGNYEQSFCGTGPDADALSHKMQEAWASFARTGDPGWAPYGTDRNTMNLDQRCHLVQAPFEEERSFWDSIPLSFTKPI